MQINSLGKFGVFQQYLTRADTQNIVTSGNNRPLSDVHVATDLINSLLASFANERKLPETVNISIEQENPDPDIYSTNYRLIP